MRQSRYNAKMFVFRHRGGFYRPEIDPEEERWKYALRATKLNAAIVLSVGVCFWAVYKYAVYHSFF